MATILMPTTNLYEKDDPIFVPIPVTIYDAFSYAKKLYSTCLSWLYLSIDVYIWV